MEKLYYKYLHLNVLISYHVCDEAEGCQLS
jgi:hypothetical protein